MQVQQTEHPEVLQKPHAVMLFITKAVLCLSYVSVLHNQLKLHYRAKQIQLHFIRNVSIFWLKWIF